MVLQTSSPRASDIMLVSSTAGRISIGLMLPCAARKIATVVGKIWIEALFITAKDTISLLGRSVCGFNLLSSRIASIPRGVAAFPSPNIFAEILRDTHSAARDFLSSFGKMSLINGESSPAILSLMPAFLIIFIIPLQKTSPPASFITTETASEAPESAAEETSPVLPKKIEKINAEAVNIIIRRFILIASYLK